MLTHSRYDKNAWRLPVNRAYVNIETKKKKKKKKTQRPSVQERETIIHARRNGRYRLHIINRSILSGTASVGWARKCLKLTRFIQMCAHDELTVRIFITVPHYTRARARVCV